MNSLTTVVDTNDDPAAVSVRSRASSIVTTTTKFSVETLSQDDQSSIFAPRERQRPEPTARPRSLASITSIARPAPPYGAIYDSTLLVPSHQNVESQLPQMRSIAAESGSIDEAIAPFPGPSLHISGTATPSPSTPPDLDDDPRAQITYYNHVVRTLDQNYTAELERLRAQHEQELATIRNDIDAAYRTQWKAKNREIEKIREEAAVEIDQAQQETLEIERELSELREQRDEVMRVLVEKARHEVEDLWEKRWRDRTRVEREERERMEKEHGKKIADAVAVVKEKWKTRLEWRDERWKEAMEEMVRHVNPELCERVLADIQAQDELMEIGFM
ncbi:MAG: hypothetical protein L6R41_007555 [Letrouitia leprolyta]|nr:MAG: hypothetical protein L6R41_007555 [Letrouitia leprolyta]